MEDSDFIDYCVSPICLHGDFNGDKDIDYAIPVIERKSGKAGILIYHPVIKAGFLIRVGETIPFKHNWASQWINSWEIVDSGKAESRAGGSRKIKLKGQAILINKSDSSSGLLYWDGKAYKWFGQGK